MSILDNPTEQPKEKITARHVGIVVLLFVLIMLPLAGMVVKQRMDEAAKAEAARVAELQKKTVAAMMVNLPQRTAAQAAQQRKKVGKKMVKIIRGTTGQADIWSGVSSNPNCPGGYLLNEGDWKIFVSTPGDYTASYDGYLESYDGQPGWLLTQDGSITVPVDATPGIYRADYCAGVGMCDVEIDGHETYYYEFEVVCMKVKIHPYTRIQ